MTIGVALLVVSSALVHAAWNAVLKRTREPDHAVIGVSTVAAFTSALVALALHAGAPPTRSLAWSFVSGALEAGYFFTLARALTLAPLGPVYTIVRGGALAVVWPVSVLALGEELTLARLLGTALVTLGLVSTGAGERGPEMSTGKPRLRGFVFACVCALFVAGYHLAYKVALSSGGRPEAVVTISLSTASLLNIALLGRAGARKVILAARDQPVHVFAAGVLASLGFVAFLFAMERAGAGVVLTLRNTSILFAQLLAFLLGDRPRRLGVIGAALVFAGAVLLAR